MKIVPPGPICNKWALVKEMACRLSGNKPLPEPMVTQLTDPYIRHPASMI